MTAKAQKEARIAQLKVWCEEVMRLAGVDSLLGEDEGEAICVQKDHRGPPGSVIIVARHKGGRVEHWKRSLKGWYVAKTEQAS